MFSCVPSDLNKVYWRNTYNDITTATRLYLGYKQSKIVQDFETFAILLSQAFGSGKKSGNKEVVTTKAQANASFNELFGPRK